MQNPILECAVRASLIAICTSAILYALRVKAARVRHAVWASVVVLMLALPVWMAWGPRAVVRVLQPAMAPTISYSTISAGAGSGQALAQATRWEMPNAPARSPMWTWQGFLTGVYLLGFFALLARLAIGTVRAHMLFRGATTAGRAGHRPALLFLTSDSCAVPVTVGWLNPTVILPGCWRRWPQAQLSAVLAHEGEHARFCDPLVQWVALLNRAIFWFHPLAWWLERRLSALAEEACDAAVLARGHDPFEYSEYLLEMARAMQQAGARVQVMGMAMPGGFLPQRIRRILEGGPAQRISRVRMVGVAIACGVVSTAFTVGAVDRAPARSPKLQVTPALAGRLSAIDSRSPLPAQNPLRKKPKVLLGQAQTSPTTPNPVAANSTQQDGGSISGTVLDPSGARVPGCLVVMHNRIGNVDNTARSDAAGLYRFASIPPGHYTLEYQMPGFAALKKEAEIEAGKPVRLDAPLFLGQISETLTVIGQRPATAPAPTAAQPVREPGPISVGGRVEAARVLTHTDPIYPPELREQGIEGTVRLAAVISRDGVPVEIRVLNGDEVDSRFVQAALDAVSQWRYQPAKLNEHPVSNVTKIDVNFELGK